jgi:excisionase family DNA binding protein
VPPWTGYTPGMERTAGLLTVSEAARELGLSRQALYHRLHSGLLHGLRIGQRAWVIPAGEVERAKQEGPLRRGPRPRIQPGEDDRPRRGQ